LAPRAFDVVVDTNPTGGLITVEAAVTRLLEQDQGGSVVLTSSVAGLHGKLIMLGNADLLGYTAAKHGVLGLMRAYASLLAEHPVRVNSVHLLLAAPVDSLAASLPLATVHRRSGASASASGHAGVP
jgi:NAD(P)-dependent dehydrogenase (short-subunit alcohol dehydrogenase family)